MRAPSHPTDLATEVQRAYRDRGGLLLLTDFDGTLTPIVSTPAAARLSPSTWQALADLAARPETGVAVISGRDLRDVQAKVDVPGMTHAGCHGLEIAGPDLAFVHPGAEAAREALVAAAGELRDALGSVPGAEVEEKALGVAVHFRRVYPSDLTEVFYQVERVSQVHAPHLTTRPGKRVLEVVPDVHWNKGECALWLRDHWVRKTSREPAIAYLGDDLTDEYAFQALRGKAFTVRVGPGPRTSAAARWVSDVGAAQRFLGTLGRALDEA